MTNKYSSLDCTIPFLLRSIRVNLCVLGFLILQMSIEENSVHKLFMLSEKGDCFSILPPFLSKLLLYYYVSGGGVYWIHLVCLSRCPSARPSVRPSVAFCVSVATPPSSASFSIYPQSQVSLPVWLTSSQPHFQFSHNPKSHFLSG